MLTDLPTTTKAQLQENFDDWVTDRAVSAQDLRRHMDACAKSSILTQYLDKYSFVSTSGTTGSPFTILRDDYHNKIHGALLANRLMNAVGADAFSPAKNKIASLIVTNPRVSSYGSFLRAKNAMPEYSQNMMAFSIGLPLESIVEQLNVYQPNVITGYPSIVTLLANEQLSGRLKINIKAIACSAEPLTTADFNIMRHAFGCPILNNYCMTEGGEVAFSNGLCSNLHLNDDWIIVEPIDANGDPASPSEYSDGILVTDLSNYISPIIRYRMTDRVIITEDDVCACQSTLPLLKICGRTYPPLTLCGKKIIAFQLASDLGKTEGILQFQLARIAQDALEVRILPKVGCDFDELRSKVANKISNTLENMGCPGVKISVVNKAPTIDPKSGKNKPVVDEA